MPSGGLFAIHKGGLTMYFYTVSDGCYEHYYETTLTHEVKYSKEQFAKMFNEAVDNGSTDSLGVADYLLDKYGFQTFEPEVFIKCDYGAYKKLTEKDYAGNGSKIDAEDKSWRTK
jgi:hypothetical protein